MARAGRTFRVFVSSTFSDLKEERNALHERVWPKLRALCEGHGARFQAVDLRWGVSAEAGRDQRTMDLCLSEIERCQQVSPRPNFVVLLGDRYGWRPLPAHVPAEEFEALRAAAHPSERPLLDTWYRRDDNAVPPEYVLLPRTTEAHDREWPRIEREIRDILRDGMQGGRVAVLDRSIYEASATEQEIQRGALLVTDAEQHVVCVFREIKGLPKEASAKEFVDLDERGLPDEDAKERLRALKDMLRTRLGHESVVTLAARWSGAGPTTDQLDRLCDEVLRRLSVTIEAAIGRLEDEDALDQEIRAHAAFGAERAQGFTGRTEALMAIGDYISEGTSKPLLVHGASGSGKSALMAAAARCLDGIGSPVVVRFLGATPASSEGRGLLDGLCRQIARAYGAESSPAPQDYRALVEDFPKKLALATADRPLVLFLDGLDQISLEDPAAACWWLPRELPSEVRLVASVMDGDLCERLRRRAPDAPTLELPPLAPTEGAGLLDSWLEDSNRRLSPGQREAVLSAFARERLPLWLRIAYERARHWRSFDLPEHLPSAVRGLIRRLFADLSAENNHGRLLVERSLALIAAGRHGLTEDELVDVLSGDEDHREVLDDFQRRSPRSPHVDRLPVVLWSRLHLDLAPYLSERAADGTHVYGFFHRQFREVVEADYLSDPAGVARHAELARYFASQEVKPSGTEPVVYNRRMLVELPYQEQHAQDWSALEHTLLEDLAFLEAKAESGQTFDLASDFADAARALPPGRPLTLHVQLIDEALRRDVHFIAHHPTTLFQCLWNTCWWYDAPDAARHYELPQGAITPTLPPWRRPGPKLHMQMERWRAQCDARAARPPWLRSLRPPALPLGSAQRSVLSGHGSVVHCVAWSPDGRQIASGSDDWTIRVWDAETGEELRCLRAHKSSVVGVSWSPDGHWLASAAWDETVRIWDVEAGAERRCLEGPDLYLRCVTWSPDGRWLSSGGEGAVWTWDTTTWKMVRALRGFCLSAGWSPDARYLACGREDEIGVWDTLADVENRWLRGRRDGFKGVAWSPNGQCLAGASWDATITIIDSATGEQRLCLRGHGDHVSGVAWSPDGQRLASASDDGSLRVWDAEAGEEQCSRRRHVGGILSVAWSPDGRWLASASSDKTLRLWVADGEGSPWLLRGTARGGGLKIWSPDRQWFARSHMDETIRIWNAATADERMRLHVNEKHIAQMAWSPDGRRLASASYDGTVRLWNPATGQELACFRGHERAVTCVAWAPDGLSLASSSADTVRVWDANTSLQGLCLRWGEVGVLSWSPDGRLLAAGSGKETRVRDLETGEERSSVPGQGETVKSIGWSPDGRWLAIGTAGSLPWSAVGGWLPDVPRGWIRVLHVEAWRESWNDRGSAHDVSSVSFSPDGRWLASTAALWSEGGELRIGTSVRKAATGELIIAVGAGDHAALMSALLTNGRTLVTDDPETAVLLQFPGPRAVAWGSLDPAFLAVEGP